MSKILITIAVIAGVLYMKNVNTPRGIRNNNAGNIRATGQWQEWQGAIGKDDKGFIVFDTAENGLRAMARTLRTYRDIYGLNTVSGIINRWAPSVENDTTSYVNHVASAIGVDANQPLNADDYPSLIATITKHENGVQPYSNQQINAGFERGFA